jgi:hypothetical protein
MVTSSSSGPDRHPSSPRQRPKRQRRHSVPADHPAASSPLRVEQPAQPSLEILPEVRPPDDRTLCVVDRSTAIDQAEADLRRTLFDSVSGARSSVTPDQVRQTITWSFTVALEVVVVAATKLEDFIVFLPDIATADQVFNGSALLQASGFLLFFRQWTRVAHAKVAALLALVQVELRGIPAHLWRRSTAQQLLGGGF